MESESEQVFPEFVDPKRCFVAVMPAFRRISRRIQVPESVGLGIDNRDLIAGSFIQRVALRSDGKTEQLSPRGIRVGILKVRINEIQYGTGDRSAIIWIERLELICDSLNSAP